MSIHGLTCAVHAIVRPVHAIVRPAHAIVRGKGKFGMNGFCASLRARTCVPVIDYDSNLRRKLKLFFFVLFVLFLRFFSLFFQLFSLPGMSTFPWQTFNVLSIMSQFCFFVRTLLSVLFLFNSSLQALGKDFTRPVTFSEGFVVL